MSMSRFQKWTRALVIYTLLVILWGAWVRISHSGDGCGDTWPLCQGKIIPDAQQGKTWVELSHRVMSGLYGFLVLGFFFWARKLFPKGHKARFWAGLSLLFTVTEALLGAKLVLFKLVGTNDTPYRALIMGLHLVNSLLLTGSVTLTGDFAGARSWIARTSSPWTFEGLKPKRIVSGLLLSFFLIGISGAIAALSIHFPARGFSSGLEYGIPLFDPLARTASFIWNSLRWQHRSDRLAFHSIAKTRRAGTCPPRKAIGACHWSRSCLRDRHIGFALTHMDEAQPSGARSWCVDFSCALDPRSFAQSGKCRIVF